METEVIHGQIIAKANHYMSVPGKAGERSFMKQCRTYRNRRISTRFRLFVRVWHSSVRFDLGNSLQMVGAIIDDKLCFQIEAGKKIDKYHPRVEFALLEVNAQGRLFE